jgi:hypothetical protein
LVEIGAGFFSGIANRFGGFLCFGAEVAHCEGFGSH